LVVYDVASCCGAPVVIYNHEGLNPGGLMGLIRRLISHLQRWTARYMVALDYADVWERRRPVRKIVWNGAIIGDLKRRFPDA
jgi:hypothetical protein